jgi:hypothetical protein
LEVAVTVAVPVLAEVTRPALEIVATLVGVMDQETDGLLVVLPSLLVPNTVICTVLPVVPVSMVGDAGPTASEDMVGFTKKPVQATPMARSASVAKEPIRRSLWLRDVIDLKLLGRACEPSWRETCKLLLYDTSFRPLRL